MKTIKKPFIYIGCFLLCVSSVLFAQESTKYAGHAKDMYSHTLQFKFYADFRQAIDEHSTNLISYSLVNYGAYNTLWNLIPSYEFGYKYKWFFKLESSCYAFMMNESSLNNYEQIIRFNTIQTYVSYNFLPAHLLHMLKFGLGPGVKIYTSKSKSEILNNYGKPEILRSEAHSGSFTFGAEMTYQWNFYKWFNVGAEVGYVFAPLFSNTNNFTFGVTLSATLSHK